MSADDDLDAEWRAQWGHSALAGVSDACQALRSLRPDTNALGRLPAIAQEVNRYSKRRAAQIPERKRIVEQALARDNYRCQWFRFIDGHPFDSTEVATLPLGCSYGTPEVHEIIPRDAWRDGYLVLDNTICLCAAHHHWVTDHSKLAAKIGLHRYSWEVPGRYQRD